MTGLATTETELLTFASQVNVAIGNVFEDLRTLSSAVSDMWMDHGADNGAFCEADLSALDAMIKPLLYCEHLKLHGAGIVFAPGQVAGKGMHLEWWCRGAGQTVSPLRLNFNRQSERFYDYEAMPWYVQARQSRQPCAAGPFVDLHGTEQYIVAFSLPIYVEDRFLGVAAADLCLDSLETLLVKGLMRVSNEALVLNAEGRVLAANTVSWLAGDLVGPQEGAGNTRSCHVGTQAHPFWTVVEHSNPRTAIAL
ncbi:MAG: cache domain-containing protein [Pseudomonas sp.]